MWVRCSRTERFGEAVAILTDDVVNADATMNFLRQRAYAAHMDGQLDLALADYRRFLVANRTIGKAGTISATPVATPEILRRAVEALRNAAAINPKAAPTRLNLARRLRDVGDFAGAEAELRAMARDFPSDEKPLVDLYHVLRALRPARGGAGSRLSRRLPSGIPATSNC